MWLIGKIGVWLKLLLAYFAGKSAQASADQGAATAADLKHEEERNDVDNQIADEFGAAVRRDGELHWSRPDC